MCLTASKYLLGFCTECCARSVAVQSETRMCREAPGSSQVYASQDCQYGYHDRSIEYDYTDTPDNVLDKYCIRCYSETTWRNFMSYYTNAWRWDQYGSPSFTHPALAYYLTDVPWDLDGDRWRKRTLHWRFIEPRLQIITEWNGVPTDPTQGIHLDFSRAQLILVKMEQRRLGEDHQSLTGFLATRPDLVFPVWWDAARPNPERGVFVGVPPEVVPQIAWGPNTIFENRAIFPQDYKWLG